MKKVWKKIVGGIENILKVGTLTTALTLFSLNSKAQERTIYDMFDHPIEHNERWWNMNEEEKVSLIDSCHTVDTSHIELFHKKVTNDCDDYVGQYFINFSGTSNLDESDPETRTPFYNYSENGKFKLPANGVSVNFVNGGGHSMANYVIGENVFTLDNFYFAETMAHNRFFFIPEEQEHLEDIYIDYYKGYSEWPRGPPTKVASNVHIFEKIDGEYVLTYKDPSAVLTNPKLDSIPPLMEFNFKDTITNDTANLVLNYNFHDGEYLETKEYYFGAELQPYDFYSGHFLDSGWFKIDEQSKNNFDFSRQRGLMKIPIYNQSGTIPLDKSEGAHKVVVEISDYKSKYFGGNVARDTIYYTIDLTSPITKLSFSNNKINYEATDPYLDSVFISKNNSPWEYLPEDSGSVDFFPIEGENSVKIKAVDKATNSTLEEIAWTEDWTKPVPTSDLEENKWHTKDPYVKHNIYEEHFKDAYWLINDSEKMHVGQTGEGNLPFEEGVNKVVLGAEDLFGNDSALVYNCVKKDSKAPVNEVQGIENSKHYNTNISGKLIATDENLENYGYELNGVENSLKESEGNFEFSEEGVYAPVFYSTDSAGHKTETPKEFVIDKTPVEIISDLENSEVHNKILKFNYEFKDKNLNEFGYNLNGEINYLENKKGELEVELEKGENNVGLWANDNATNSSSSDYEIIYKDTATGIEKKFSEKDFVICPNPVGDYLNIKSKKDGENNLKIYSLDGKLLKEENYFGDNYQTDISNFSSGMYLIKINDSYSGKVVKQ